MALYRIKFARNDPVRTHKEFVERVRQAVDSALLPVAQRGANAQARLVFGRPLGEGHRSRAEYADLELAEAVTCAALRTGLSAQLPRGIEVLWVGRIRQDTPNLQASAEAFDYTVTGRDFDSDVARRFGQAETWPYERDRGDRVQRFDMVRSVSALRLTPGRAEFTIEVRKEGTPKPEEVLEALFGLPRGEAAGLAIERAGVRHRPWASRHSDLERL